MASEKPLLSENIGLMILQELKKIRTEIKEEIQTLGNHLKQFNKNANISRGYRSNIRRNTLKKSSLTKPIVNTINLLSKQQQELDILAEAGKSINLENESGEKTMEYTEVIPVVAEITDQPEAKEEENINFPTEFVQYDVDQNNKISPQKNLIKNTQDLVKQLLPEDLSVHKALNCGICGRLIQSFEYLLRHFRRNHKLVPKIKCCFCDQLFSGGLMLRKHLSFNHFDIDLSGLDLTAFICFNDQDEPTIKSLINERENKNLNSPKTKAIKRQETPRAKKPRRVPLCDVCGKDFLNQAELKKHMFTHFGNEKFKCEICHREFNLKSHLRAHIKIHQTGQHTHYDCPLCKNVYFYTKNRLVNHMTVMHPGFLNENNEQLTVSVNLDSEF